MKVKLSNKRIAFVDIFQPRAVGDGDPRFGVRFIISPKDPEIKAIDAAIEAVAKEKWRDKAPAILAKIIKDGNCCFVKGEYLDKNGEPYDGFAGSFSLGAHSKVRPLVIDRDKSALTEADGRPYSGSFVNATVDLWAQDNAFGRRINATLTGIQFFKDGEAFTGGQPADPDDFDDLAETGETEDSLVD